MKTTAVHADFQLIAHTISAVNIKNDFVQMGPVGDYKKLFELSHRIVSVTDSDKGYFLGVLELTTIATVSKAKDKYKAKIVLEGMFAGQKDVFDEEAFEGMLNINGVTALYSIARSTLISFSSQTLSQGSIILPMINVFDYSQNTTEKDARK